jgi:hypothetical protein
MPTVDRMFRVIVVGGVAVSATTPGQEGPNIDAGSLDASDPGFLDANEAGFPQETASP